MKHPLSHSPPGDIENGPKDANLKIPTMTLSTLVSMVAIARWVVCDHDAMTNPGFRRAVQYMEQLVYEQSHAQAGADEIWQDQADGSFHHPTFPEQQGDAWQAVEEYNDEVFRIKLIEMASKIMADREQAEGGGRKVGQQHYEHLMQDIEEQWGVEELLRALMT